MGLKFSGASGAVTHPQIRGYIDYANTVPGAPRGRFTQIKKPSFHFNWKLGLKQPLSGG